MRSLPFSKSDCSTELIISLLSFNFVEKSKAFIVSGNGWYAEYAANNYCLRMSSSLLFTLVWLFGRHLFAWFYSAVLMPSEKEGCILLLLLWECLERGLLPGL